MKRILFRLVKLKQYKQCVSCGRFKHWRQFKRPQPGGILPMLVYDECNLCAKVRAWYSQLSKYKKEALELKLEEPSDDELCVCEACGQRRYGERRAVFSGRWICNFCFWSHCFGRKMIEF